MRNTNTSVFAAPAFREGAEYVIEADALNCLIHQSNLRIVDVRSKAQSPDGHIPGAIRFDATRLIDDDMDGLRVPNEKKISQIFGDHGISSGDFVVAYDDDTGANAARLLWTLDLIGHNRYAMLDGGFAAWEDAGLDIAADTQTPNPVLYPAPSFTHSLSDIHAVDRATRSGDVVIIDTRSPKEFNGLDNRANKSGHIPGAINFDWINTLDLIEGGKLRSSQEILACLEKRGILPHQKIILYCQTNRRSSHAFVVLRWLGFNDISTYPGAWEQWGNSDWTKVKI